jgi:tRNA1Val (adenine37-N6)-methyltransferase
LPNDFFSFKQFTIRQDKCAMKVTSLACIQGAWLPDIAPRRVLDIGAGTGLLTLMAAQKYQAHFDAIEIDALTFEQLNENIRESPWHGNITCFHNSIQKFAKQNSITYDLIITNPPFFTNQLKSPNGRINMARHEDGLTMETLVEICSNLIKPEGLISILLPLRETIKMRSLAASFSLLPVRSLTISDRPYKSPTWAVTLLGKTSMIPQSQQLTIKDKSGGYSAQFKSLLGAYYLNL